MKVPFSDVVLHRIKSGKKNEYCFFGKQVSEILGYKDMASAIKKGNLVEGEDYVIVEKAKCPKDVWEQVSACGAVTSKTPRFTMIYESGFWKLAMKCELSAGVKLRNWLANDVLPTIRQTGSFSMSPINVTAAELINNSKREIQIQNSKDINTFNYEKGGVKEVIRYNVENCKQVTGETPAVVIKRYGRPCKNSAKEALRKTDPAKAMTMSMNDYLVIKHEAKIEMLGELDKHLINTFEEMLKLGFNLVIE